MKKRLSFSQLTILSLSLLPLQHITASTPQASTSPKSPRTLASATTTTTTPPVPTLQAAGWFSLDYFRKPSAQSTSNQLASKEKLLEAELLKAAQNNTLVTGNTINPELITQEVDPAIFAGYVSSILNKQVESRLVLTKAFAEENAAARKAFMEADSKRATTIAQLLSALQTTNHISVRQVKDVQQKNKEGRDCFDGMVKGTIVAGYKNSEQSKEQRTKIDEALMSGGGTKAFTGQTSPRVQALEYLEKLKKQPTSVQQTSEPK